MPTIRVSSLERFEHIKDAANRAGKSLNDAVADDDEFALGLAFLLSTAVMSGGEFLPLINQHLEAFEVSWRVVAVS
jgi:hypothetical protein